MYPVIFKIGPVSIYSYGLMLAIGFGLAAYLAQKRAAVEGIKPAVVIDLVFWIIILGILGARLMYILENFDYYSRNIPETVMINKGGLVLYGGLILASLATIIFVKIKSLPLWKIADILMPYVALGQAIGRIGCFLNGCCYGKVTSCFLGVKLPGHDFLIHPTQLYESAVMLIIFFVLLFIRRVKRYDGQIFLFYILFYSAARYFIEFLRGDNPVVFAGMTISQSISLLLFLAAAISMMAIAIKRRVKT